MPLPPPRDHRISVPDAAAMTKRFRDRSPGAIKGFFFHVEQVRQLLGRAGVAGLRIYNGVDGGGNPAPILVPVDDDGNDMLPQQGEEGGTAGDGNGNGDDDPLQHAYPCPPYCGDDDPLDP